MHDCHLARSANELKKRSPLAALVISSSWSLSSLINLDLGERSRKVPVKSTGKFLSKEILRATRGVSRSAQLLEFGTCTASRAQKRQIAPYLERSEKYSFVHSFPIEFKSSLDFCLELSCGLRRLKKGSFQVKAIQALQLCLCHFSGSHEMTLFYL
jgi:hypothetical protein